MRAKTVKTDSALDEKDRQAFVSSAIIAIVNIMTCNSTDITVRDAMLYLILVQTRVQLNFGVETLTYETYAVWR